MRLRAIFLKPIIKVITFKNKVNANHLRKWIPIGAILMLAATFYLYQIGGESLQSDEIYSVYDAQNLNLKSWWKSPRPLYYHLLRVWMFFGTSDAWLRGLSVFFGVGSVLLIYQLGSVIAGKSIGLISAFLLTFSPLFINHVQEVRMYALSSFLSLGGTLALVYALKQQNNFSMSLWSIFRYLAIITTPLNAALLIPDLILIICRFYKQPNVLFNFAKWFLLLSILWLPNAIGIIVNSGAKFMGVKDNSGAFQSNAVSLKFSISNIIYSLFPLPRIFTAWPFQRPVSNILDYFYTFYSTILVCVFGIGLREIKRSTKLAWIAMWALFPLSLLVLVSQVSRSLMVDRYLLFISPYILIILSVGLIWIWNRWRIGAIIVAIIYAVAVGGGLTRYYTHFDHDDWRNIGQLINSNEQVGDTIVVSVPSFFRPPNARPEIVAGHYHQGSAPIHIIQRPWQNEEQIVELFLENLPPIRSRLWIIYWQGSTQQYQKFQAGIQREFYIQKQYQFRNNIRVMLVTSN